MDFPLFSVLINIFYVVNCDIIWYLSLINYIIVTFMVLIHDFYDVCHY